MLGGYMGQILNVDLTHGGLSKEPLDQDMARKYISGYGLGARILYDRMKPGVVPLSPDNILGFVTGVLTGTPAMEGNRFMVVCKSPLTHTWGDSNCGGFFGPGLKAAGYDAVFFTGKAEKPVYLFIQDGEASLENAEHLWGKDTNETEDLLKRKHGADAQVACIGEAGEKLSLISGIIHDHGRAAGRSGVGAVMGSKNLKAVVVQGRQEIPMAHPEKAANLRKKYREHVDQSTYDFFATTGTIGDLAPGVTSGDSPVKNWTGAGAVDFHKGSKAFEPDKVMAYQTKRYGCWKCTLACGGYMEVVDGPYQIKGHKVEYETGAAFGTMTLNDDFESIIKCSDLCNRFGFDSISAGCTVTFAIECYMKGALPPALKEELELYWGNDRAIVELLQRMGERRPGMGELLADGVKVAAARLEQLGYPQAHEFAIHIQGQEIPMHDPKREPGLATTYVMDATPGRHTQGGEGSAPKGLPAFKDPIPREQQGGRGELHKEAVCYAHVSEAAGICNFGYYAYNYRFIPEFLTAVTGEKWDLDRCLITGERIATIRHLFNLREGLNPLDWEVPGRLLGRPPMEEGPHKGFIVELDVMVQDYLKAMQWDPKTTEPNPKRLAELGIDLTVPILL